jgi:hypothetical protein
MKELLESSLFVELSHWVGWLAAGLVFVSFYLRTISSLRLVAVISNVAFMLYAICVSALPIFVLHMLLLPLNIVRLIQHYRLKTDIEKSSNTNLAQVLLLPHMRQINYCQGAILFEKNEPAETLLYVVEGNIELIAKGEVRGKDELLGVVGAFTRDRKRLDTAVARTAVHVGEISVEKVDTLMLREPALGRFLLRYLAEHATG